MKRVWAIVGVLIGSLIGGCTGFITSSVYYLRATPQQFGFLADRISLPHHVAQFQGGATLRFAMVHDVLHERFSRHSPEWYESRNRRTQELLSEHAANLPETWPLIDDIAVAYDRLGQPEMAIPLLKDKLAQQQSAGIEGRDLYTSYANLGTMLIHANLNRARTGDDAAWQLVDEGAQWIRQSVVVHPEAHFGREKWQAAIVEFLRATIAEPRLLTTFDCVGNRLDMSIESILDREQNWVQLGYGRPNIVQFSQRGQPFDEVPHFFEKDIDYDDPVRWGDLRPIRNFITSVGAEEGWDAVDVPSHRARVPFDEPVLGIIGMWRQGGGANPHFALALGEIMLRVGQRYISWNALERAALLADHFSSDPSAQQFLRSHCAQRQAAIEKSLRFIASDGQDRNNTPWQYISLPMELATIDQLRASFQRELNYGLQFQQQYQDYEKAQIAQGRSTSDLHFFEEFESGREAIATSVGLEETVLVVPRSEMKDYIKRRTRAIAILSGGIGAMFVSIVGMTVSRLRNRRVSVR